MAENTKKGFNLAEALKDIAVPDLGTVAEGREQIEYIDIDRIDDDPNNFYELSSLDELAANIELLGLQQPIRVRTSPENIDRVIIVSGHRRRAAIRKLVDEGRADLREIPCIREKTESSAALQELRLIYANSDTRKLSSAEISKQAERVEDLLYQLKEEGYEFPGRMRDHVAEACKVSKSKLSRLKVIREQLIPEYAEHFQSGDLSESSAYRLAKEPEDIQRLAWKYDGQVDAEKGRMSYTTEWQIDNALCRIKRVIERKCKHPNGTCTHCETMLGKVFDSKGYSPCDYYCCDTCRKLTGCKDACPKMAETAAKLKLETKTQRAEERAATKALDQINAQAISQIWKRFGEARTAAAVSVDECFDRMDIKYASISREKYPAFESLEDKITGKTDLPFGFAIDLEHIRRLTNLADLLGVSLDYLLCRTDEVQTTSALAKREPEPGISQVMWFPQSVEPAPKQHIVAIDCDGYADEGIYLGNGKMDDGCYFDWEEVALWTPRPDINGAVPAPAIPEQAMGQLVINGWMPGGTFPMCDSDVVADFQVDDGKVIRQVCCYRDGHYYFLGSGARIDTEVVRWMCLPPVE